MKVNEVLERMAAHKAQGNGEREVVIVGSHGEWLEVLPTEFDTTMHDNPVWMYTGLHAHDGTHDRKVQA